MPSWAIGVLALLTFAALAGWWYYHHTTPEERDEDDRELEVW